MHLEAVGSGALRRLQHTRIVDEDVQRSLLGEPLGRECADRRARGQIQVAQKQATLEVFAIASLCADLREYSLYKRGPHPLGLLDVAAGCVSRPISVRRSADSGNREWERWTRSRPTIAGAGRRAPMTTVAP